MHKEKIICSCNFRNDFTPLLSKTRNSLSFLSHSTQKLCCVTVTSQFHNIKRGLYIWIFSFMFQIICKINWRTYDILPFRLKWLLNLTVNKASTFHSFLLKNQCNNLISSHYFPCVDSSLSIQNILSFGFYSTLFCLPKRMHGKQNEGLKSQFIKFLLRRDMRTSK